MNPEIKLHNTMSGKVEVFTPLTPNEVSMYHCGPTVYNYFHVGNLRAYLLADTLRRMFEANHYKVHQVINITDVGHLTANNDEGFGDDGEDKVEKMARQAGKTADEITAFYTDAFLKDIADLNIRTDGTEFPRATHYIQEQIALIEQIEKKGLTYVTSDGVYFNTALFPGYGKLGNINIEGLRDGARIGVNSEKKNITDFALWKFSHPTNTSADATGSGSTVGSSDAAKRFQEWPSPWGVGFPGWHIECSAMSEKLLGVTFDIHTGGIDHIPVHHNNEIAQSETAHDGAPLAHYWLHGAFVNMADGKMSKSKDNFIRLATLREEGISALEYRYWLLGAHYSTPVHFSLEAVKAAAQGYKKLVAQVAELDQSTKNTAERLSTMVAPSHWNTFLATINDDLNTPQALAHLFDMLRDISLSKCEKLATLVAFDAVLGLDLVAQAELLVVKEIPPQVKKLFDRRHLAREAKDWGVSDELRKEIEAEGFELKDTDGGQVVQRAQ